jgi:soluble lytic murein transglycosylase-like protein
VLPRGGSVLVIGAVLLFLVLKNEAQAVFDPEFDKYNSLYRKYAKAYRVPWRWIKAIAIVESNQGKAASVARGLLNPTDVEGSKSSDGLSWGIMQTTLANARERFGMLVSEAWLNNPENSIMAGAAYLGYLIRLFGLNEEKVSRAYNGGPGYAKTALGQTMTPIYYGKFKAALALVLSKNPGDVLEI